MALRDIKLRSRLSKNIHLSRDLQPFQEMGYWEKHICRCRLTRFRYDTQSTSQIKFQMVTVFCCRHIGGLRCPAIARLQILGSIILRGTFPRISQLWDNTHTLNLENCNLCLSCTIQCFDFIYPLHSFIILFFYYVTVHTHYQASLTSIKKPAGVLCKVKRFFLPLI